VLAQLLQGHKEGLELGLVLGGGFQLLARLGEQLAEGLQAAQIGSGSKKIQGKSFYPSCAHLPQFDF